jgi:hypothetical protein
MSSERFTKEWARPYNFFIKYGNSEITNEPSGEFEDDYFNIYHFIFTDSVIRNLKNCEKWIARLNQLIDNDMFIEFSADFMSYEFNSKYAIFDQLYGESRLKIPTDEVVEILEEYRDFLIANAFQLSSYWIKGE